MEHRGVGLLYSEETWPDNRGCWLVGPERAWMCSEWLCLYGPNKCQQNEMMEVEPLGERLAREIHGVKER